MEEVAKVVTFYDDETEAEMVLLSVSQETGLCKCLYESAHENLAVRVARHRDRVRPVNDAAREMLKLLS